MIDATTITALALDCGFPLCGITEVTPMDPQPLQSWLDAGYGAEMQYLRRHLPLRAQLTKLLPDAKSVISLATPYLSFISDEKVTVADYARGVDYHEVIMVRLQLLWKKILPYYPAAMGNCYVDTAPLPERELARRAGIGWVGKNSCLINPQYGSRILLGEILTNLPLQATGEMSGASPVSDFAGCGNCQLCMQTCPTGAITTTGQVDSRRCLSYLTIESRGAIPREFRHVMGSRLFGCDNCQQVCPFNQNTMIAESLFTPFGLLKNIELSEILQMTTTEFQQRFHGTPNFTNETTRVVAKCLCGSGKCC